MAEDGYPPVPPLYLSRTQSTPDSTLWSQPTTTFLSQSERRPRRVPSESQLKLPKEPRALLHWMVPFTRNKDFVERAWFTNALHSSIDWLRRQPPSPQPDNVRRVTAIQGIGGVGKTQLALEYAYQQVRLGYSVFWVPAFDAASFEKAFRKIGRRLGVDGIENEGADVKKLVKAALEDTLTRHWLLIIDGADDVDLLFGDGGISLSECIPQQSRGTTLVTTRDAEVSQMLVGTEPHGYPSHHIEMGAMRRSESLKLLAKHIHHAGHPSTTSGNASATSGDASTAAGNSATTREMLDFLNYLPLAIRQACAYMTETQTSITQYVARIKAFQASSQMGPFDLLTHSFEAEGRYPWDRNAIAETWLITFDYIARRNTVAANYLRRAGSLPHSRNRKFVLMDFSNLGVNVRDNV
ncbi:P-loop containing nucleoside triphosphate hydrolase protein [Cercophora newfieldiana]|uniref:P-loop containing nucleoside triphosphate hydrolase protein n=1 Tax=Cercophora newfieldiana TaxID=92897 RepID=A0AA40CLZ1_9PEZI|nr:P-loop containing nucleoside triphosphate hydrolase protein [Cercophora newfieldiana]